MSAPIIRRVSRRELASNRFVWLATGGTYAALAIGVTVMAFTVPGVPLHRYQLMVAILASVAILHLRSEPPALGTFRNHLVLASVYLTTSLAFWVFQPGGSVAIGASIFIGPLIAVRLQDRRLIIAHAVFAITVLFWLAVAGIAFGTVDHFTVLAIFIVMPATCVLAYSCVIVLEAAEAQGEELERLVRRDPLTGVGNRRLLDELLEDEIIRHERTQRPLSLIALDLNGFKVLNDSMGHAAGDDLLRAVAEALLGVVENRDTVVRQGGDEFCIVLPETTAPMAARTGNAVRAALAGVEVSGGPITTGIGIATFPDDAIDSSVLLHVADERLRANKPVPPEGSDQASSDAAEPPQERRAERSDRRQA